MLDDVSEPIPRPIIASGRGLKFLCHLFSMWLVMPSLLFACACLVLDHAVSRPTLLGFFAVIWLYLVVLVPWGLVVVLICFLTLAAAGAHPAWRRPAAGVVAVLALGSAATLLWAAGWPKEAGQCWFYLPNFIAVLISGWLIFGAE